MKYFTFIVFFLVIMAGKITGQRTYKNPVITGMNPDPSICRVGDDYYLATSTFEYFPGVPVYHSKDLVHWKQIGHALDSKINCPLGGAGSSGGNYAPAMRYNNGIFYVTCTNYGGQGSQGAFYVTATNPAGPWSDPVWVGNWNVDPSIMFANDSMYWVSPDNNGSFMVGTYDPLLKQFITPLRLIAAGLGGSSPEGPHIYKINDYYYLMSAEGGTGYEHREVIQRSKSPYGPFEPSPYNPVISNMNHPERLFHAIGHADMVQIKDSTWWLFCLGIRPKGGRYHHLGRETFLAPVTWTDDGWPVAGNNGVMMEEFLAPNLPEHIWEKEPVRDDFNGEKLGLQWNFLRNPYDADWSLTEKPGFLRLKGSAVNLSDKDSPAFIGRRQTDFNMVASAKINFIPVSENEEAGLVVRGNDENYFSLYITLYEGKRMVALKKFLKNKIIELTHVFVPEGDVILRISATDLEYVFWAQEEGKAAIKLGSAPTKDISTEIIGGFIGAYIGMYATGNGSVNTNPADFEWFDYEKDVLPPYIWTIK
ncbi:MAG: glycoside hydrolase family 43 protein [Bacteroidales bacterium]|nr:glycoside hydrolase family 43 protein [Bacteroidales bacterium]